MDDRTTALVNQIYRIISASFTLVKIHTPIIEN